VTLPTEKHDLIAIATQRNQIGRMIAHEEARFEPVMGATPLANVARSEKQEMPEADATDTIENVEEAAATVTQTLCEATGSDPDPDDNANDPSQQDPPDWIIQQASLSELLLWRLGIPIDRELIEREHRAAQDSIDLKPPITTRKVAHAIAHLSLQLIEGKLDANSAKTSLYALQTLLTALRLQIVEEKKAKATVKKKSERKKPNAKRKR
jgi:hypothetical protein